MKKDVLAERDRFVGFAFAAADVLLELDAANKVISVSGAALSLLGLRQAELDGVELLSLVATIDRPVARRLLKGLTDNKQGARLDPFPIRLAHSSGAEVKAMIGGCKLPMYPDVTLMTLVALPLPGGSNAAEAARRDPDSGLLHGEELFTLAAKASAEPAAKARNLVLLRINGLGEATRSMPSEQAKELMAEVGGALRAMSLGADMAARLSEDEFGLVQDPARQSASTVESEIQDIAKIAGLAQGVLRTSIESVELTTSELDDEGAARAIAYAVRSFTERSGSSLSVGALERGLPGAVTAAVSSMVALQHLIRSADIRLVFQPIVALGNREIHHYEALVRFPDGRSTFEAVKFAEGIGLSEELDMVVCSLALAELRRVGGTASVAVNMSGRSVTSDSFRHALTALLDTLTMAERRRLMFELTESTMVDSVEDAVGFLSDLKRAGHGICLDDFGAGAAAYAYLRHFDVDIVKVDGPFLKAAILRDRERALIRSVCRLCRDLNCSVVGEMIEEERQAEAAVRLGIDFGQGWLFGKPMPQLPEERPKPAARRSQGYR